MLNGPNGISQINADFYNLKDLNPEFPDLNMYCVSSVFLVVVFFMIARVGKHINSKFFTSDQTLGMGLDPKEYGRFSLSSEKTSKSDLGLKYSMSDEEATKIIHYKPTTLNSSFMQKISTPNTPDLELR